VRAAWSLTDPYAYLFIDGVHMSIRLGEDDRVCLLA
jgi:hypothetical protein